MTRAVLVVLALLAAHDLLATHRRGAYIQVRQVSGLRYEIVLNLYTNLGSSVQPESGFLHTGDGRVIEVSPNSNFEMVVSRVSPGTLRTRRTYEHTFGGSGTYRVWFEDFNRNAGILNIENSVDVPFAVYTEVVIDPVLGSNVSPRIDNAPNDFVAIATPMQFAPLVSDPDGDSVSFHLSFAKLNATENVPGYRFPGQLGTSNSFSIDPISGRILWDQPTILGRYTLTYEVREWRNVNGVNKRISTTQFDYLVTTTDNAAFIGPSIEMPAERCFAMDFEESFQITNVSYPINVRLENDYDGELLFDGTSFTSDSKVLIDQDTEFTISGKVSSSFLSYYQVHVSLTDTAGYFLGSDVWLFGINCDQILGSMVTGIEALETQFAVYPNPASQNIRIDLSHVRGKKVDFQILNLSGREYYFDQFYAELAPMKFSTINMPRGIYLVRIMYENKQETQRFVLK